jgi:hypothetical protein
MRWLDANLSRVKLLAAAVLFATCVVTGGSQQQLPTLPTRPNPPGSPSQAPNSSDENDGDTMAHRAMMQQAQKRNAQRQQEIVNATDKLVTLTEQLKVEMEKGSKDQMSAKKVEEIEKLAKSVKEKMKGS